MWPAGCRLATPAVNHQIIAQKINDVIYKLDIARENFVFLLSDAAVYMVAIAIALKHFYLKLFHVTCLAYLLYNYIKKYMYIFQI